MIVNNKTNFPETIVEPKTYECALISPASPAVAASQNSDTSLENILGMKCSREAALERLQSSPDSYDKFLTFDPYYQDKLLQFMMGNCGLEITYNNYFKNVLSPSLHKERVEKLISCLIGQKVKIKQVLPLEGNRLSDGSSLVIMDILVELSDSSIVNIEMQKIGYLFPSERSSCYAADLIMRQYNRLKADKGKEFCYRDMKPVYLIIFMEDSATDFKCTESYIHRRVVSYDSGISLPEITQITFVALDRFREIVQNINTELDAWLTFFSCSDAAHILELTQKYPEFLDCYKDIAIFRTNPKELIHMFSEALYEMDRNTVKFMIDEKNKEIDEKNKEIAEKDKVIAEKNNTIAEKDNTIAEKDNTIAELGDTISKNNNEIAKLQAEIKRLQNI